MLGESLSPLKQGQILLILVGLLGAILSGYLFVSALFPTDNIRISGSTILIIVFYMLIIGLFVRYRSWRRKRESG